MVYVKFLGPLSSLMQEKDENGFWAVDAAGKTISSVLGEFDFKNITYITLINNMREDKNYVLQDGDKLSVMPTLAGG